MLLARQIAEMLREEQLIEPFSEMQLDRMREIYREAFKQAVKEADALNWSISGSLTNLGRTINARYASCYEYPECRDGMLFAKKWLWIAARENQLTWLGWIADGLVENNSTTRSYASLEAQHEDGLFCAVIMKFSEIAYSDAIEQKGKFKKHEILHHDLLNCIAQVWLCEADALMGAGNKDGALDMIDTAYTAKINAGDSYYGGRNAQRAAIARHLTTYELRDKIIAHWRDNIGADKSNEFAAELLQKEFPEVAHRTLARYISEAKKLPPAGTL